MIEERQYRRKRLWTRPQLLVRHLLLGWPFLIWLGAAIATVWLYSGRIHYGQLTGVVEVVADEVAPVVTARLRSIDIAVGQEVQAGDAVAHMDTALLDASLAADERDLRLREDAAAQDDAANLRAAYQLEGDAGAARADLAEAQVEQSRMTAQLAELRLELARREELLRKRMLREEDVGILKPEIADLAKAVEGYPQIIAARQQRVEKASAGTAEFRAWMGAQDGETVPAAVARRAAERALAGATALAGRLSERDVYVLRAARSGRVSRVYHAPGTVVAAGDPVVRIVATTNAYIVGFLPETQLLELRVGDPVTAWRQNVLGGHVAAVVETVSPDVQALPGRLNPIQGAAVRGRRVTLRLLDDGAALIPGETMHLELNRTTWIGRALAWPRAPSSAGGAADDAPAGVGP